MNEYEIGRDIQELKTKLANIESALLGTETGKFGIQGRKTVEMDHEPIELEEYQLEQVEQLIGETDGSGEKGIFDGYRLILGGGCKNWKEFHFPTGNEHYARHWGDAHVIDKAGNIVKWNAIEVGSDFGCSTTFPNYQFRNYKKIAEKIEWNSRRVNGYKTWSGWLRFTMANGSWIQWTLKCKC